ncbi:MAG: heparan-alpha-glucosaminide N-acetyltransferase domain-containing protein, partial [Thermoplasmatota archaeon]
KQLAFLGKHSLLIYLIHQPLLLILLYGLGLISINLI